MTEIVHLGIYDLLADWETGHATSQLNNDEFQREPGRYRVKTVGLTRDPITTMGALRIVPDLALDELDPAESAMLILPGSDNWVAGTLTPFGDKARDFVAAGVPVAAICGATFGLAAAGLLDDREHTSNHPDFLAHSGYAGAAHYREADAVGGDVITASGTEPVAFAREIFRRLDFYSPELLDAWFRLYSQSDPAAFYQLAASVQ
ncbi:MAG: glutamine amidotransferase [Mycobacteriaceae bacterium]|nr:glutamine amidotransferase [Mycobacteriaceae bacterium]